MHSKHNHEGYSLIFYQLEGENYIQGSTMLESKNVAIKIKRI